MSAVTKNGIHQIRTGPKKEGVYYTVQILNIKLIGEKRYRAIISDGDSFDQAFVGGPSYHYFKNNMVQEKQLIKIKDFSLTEITSGIIITLNEIEPGPPLQSTIGNPEKYVGKPVQAENTKKFSSNKENLEFTSVKALTSNSRDFAIKARITKKNDIKEWKNERGAGKLFSINLIDSYNEEISVTFFKEEAEKYFSMLEEGKVYIFKNGQVKISNKRFQSVDSEYNIIIDKRSEILPTSDESEISSIKFNPVTIESISNLQVNNLVDLCAGIIDCGELIDLLSKKTNKNMKKRSVRLIDQSNAIIELTLWNEDAMSSVFDYPSLPIILVGKSLRVSNFNGVSLSTDRACTQLLYNPDLPQVKILKTWLSRNSNHSSARLLSMRPSIGGADRVYKTFAEIKQETEICEKEESFLISGCIGFIRKDDPSNLFYVACKNSNKCKKKVTQDSNGWYHCESCQESFEKCEFKYLISMKLQDFSDALWVTVFDDVAITLLGCPASDLHNYFIENITLFEETLAKVSMKRIDGVIKVKMNDTAQGKKPRHVLTSAKPADPIKGLSRNLAIISEYLNN